MGDHHGQETGCKCDFNSIRKNWTFGSGPLLCQRIGRRREETACKRRRKEINLVFVIFMLHVLMYVVSGKLFWNWNGVMRFVSQDVWFDKGFVIWNFFNYCLVQTVSLWSLSIGAGIISTTNELVGIIRDFKSNASRFKKISNVINVPHARFFYETKCAAGKVY